MGKVRHMFDVQHQPPGWVNDVREEILRRCAQAKILHIAVDTQSEEGTVYIKTLSTEEAGKVFGCLHGQWYRGQLVTASTSDWKGTMRGSLTLKTDLFQ